MKHMNKILALLLAVLMVIGLAACGGGGKDTSTDTPDSSAPATGNDAAAGNDTADSEPAGGDASSEGEAELPDENLTVHESTFFTVGYNEEDGWVLAEDDYYMSEYGGNAYIRILDEDGYTDVVVEIDAYEEDASSFREALYNNGIDLKDYVDGTCELKDIGGISMAAADLGDGDWYFFGRDVAAGVNYSVYVSPMDETVVPALLENITFTASGTDNIDPPWPWEGEPISAGTASQMIGTYTLTAEFIPMGEAMVTYSTFEHDIAVIGDTVYLLSDYALYEYAYDGASLSLVKEIPLDGEYEFIEKTDDGTYIISGFMEPVVGYNGDAAQFTYEGPDHFSVAPGGTWGISWFTSGEDCELYAFNDGTLSGSPFPFPEVDIIGQVCIDENYIFVSGSSVEDDDHYVFVYDYSGELQLQLGGEPDGWGLGSITYAVSTPNGFLALDGNMREVVLWTADGTWIGAADDSDLFGTNYPWIAAADMAEDGSILIVMSDERWDESADEVIVFKLSGF